MANLIPKQTPTPSRYQTPLASFTYFLLVLILWAPYGLKNGMPYETAFVYESETRSLLRGFLFHDPLRVYTSFFYHTSYLLGRALGLRGSFVPYQLVYAALWWGRGFFAFLIVRRLLPQYAVFGYFVGAAVLFHASDSTLNWVGQLNQFGFIFWMLLSFHCVVAAIQAASPFRRWIEIAAADFFCYMSLWSYESQLFMMLAFPALVLLLYVRIERRHLAPLATYYGVQMFYVALNFRRYLVRPGGSYQESVLRADWVGSSLASDLVFNIAASLRFWNWAASLPVPAPERRLVWLAVLAISTFSLGALLVQRLSSSVSGVLPPRRALLRQLLLGSVLLVLSFPAYIILSSARMLWRTQLLSGFGAALIFVALACLAASLLKGETLRLAAVVWFGSILAFFGTMASLKTAGFHYMVWERHRQAMAEVLEIAPRVKQDSVVVLTNVPREADPFGHNMWFDVALRLAYPRTRVAGVYFYHDGAPAPGTNMVLQGGRWSATKQGFATLIGNAAFAHTLVVQFDKDGHPGLLRAVPDFLAVDPNTATEYDPFSVIEPGPPSPLALRRYAPIRGPDGHRTFDTSLNP